MSKGEPVKYYLPAEEIFDVIETAHFIVGHGCRDRLENETLENVLMLQLNYKYFLVIVRDL